MMKRLLIALGLIALGLAVPVAPRALAGGCDHSYQTAKDGSSCGGRAADRRAGGR